MHIRRSETFSPPGGFPKVTPSATTNTSHERAHFDLARQQIEQEGRLRRIPGIDN